MVVPGRNFINADWVGGGVYIKGNSGFGSEINKQVLLCCVRSPFLRERGPPR